MASKKKHQTPSKIRYAEKHPSVTIHLTDDEYRDVKELTTNNDKSFNQLLKEAAGLAVKNWKKYNKIFEEGM